jgi:hypothetical protein
VAWETTRLILVDSGGYSLISSSVPLGFRLARLHVLNRFLEVVTPRSLVEASVRNVYGDPSKVTRELVDRYFDMIVCTGIAVRWANDLLMRISAPTPAGSPSSSCRRR